MSILKKKVYGLCVLFLAAAGTVYAGDEVFQLVRDGKAETVIVMPQNPSDNIRRTVTEFLAQVKKSTGAGIARTTAPRPGKNQIRLVLEKRPLDQRDRFTIQFPNPQTMRIIGTEDSIAYALDYLLENSFNVRRLIMNYPDSRWRDRPARFSREIEVSCEPVKSASIPCREVTRTASFNLKRHIYSHRSGWKVRESFKGIHDMTAWAFPASKYAPGNTWPEEILPVINGKRYKMPKADPRGNNGSRFKMNWQPCWSNPASVEIAAANIIEQVELKRKKGEVYSVNLDINDNGGCCTCPDCLAVVNKYTRPGHRKDYSPLYWKWVNGIAERVTKKYPDLYFNCLAYREVINPPEFKLHPNVIPQICRELSSEINPDVKKTLEQLFREWSKKASVIFLWDYQYGGGRAYVLPRVYFHRQANLFKKVHSSNVRGVFIECKDCIGMDGPKYYLDAKLMWDVNTDVDQVLQDWCEHAAGKKGAPFLLEYYKFWEDYWERPEVRQTNWAGTARGIYMQLNEQGTYTYALRKGEMAGLRKLLEKAAAAAETPQQKKRMAILLNETFACAEASAKGLFSEYLQPDGTVSSAADALALLKAVPEAVKAVDWLMNRSVFDKDLCRIVESGMVSNVNAVLPYLKDPAVKAEIRKLAASDQLPNVLKAQLQVMTGKKFRNLFPQGSFEEDGPLPPRVRRDTAHAADGKYAIKFHNSGFWFMIPGAKPEKTFYIALDVYSVRGSAEGRFNVLLAPCANKRTVDWKRLTNLKLGKGWQTVAFAFQVSGRNKAVDEFKLVIQANHFESDEPLWVDNIRVYQLD